MLKVLGLLYSVIMIGTERLGVLAASLGTKYGLKHAPSGLGTVREEWRTKEFRLPVD